MCPRYLFEMRVLNFIQDNIRNSFFDSIFVFITKLGDYGLIWILLALYFIFYKKNVTIGIMIFIALLSSAVVTNFWLKELIARPRPYTMQRIDLLIKKSNEFSFPSGHTSSSFAVAMIIYHFKKDFGKWMLVLAGLIGFSRVYIFFHYPTDIIGGLAIGILLADGIYYIYTKIYLNKKNKEY